MNEAISQDGLDKLRKAAIKYGVTPVYVDERPYYVIREIGEADTRTSFTHTVLSNSIFVDSVGDVYVSVNEDGG